MDNYLLVDLFYKSGNKAVDDFINLMDMMGFVPYDQFKDIKFIAKVESYEATWIESNIKS